jgi:Dyp-type peroxidase family
MLKLQEGILTPKSSIKEHKHTAILCLNVVSGTTPAQLLEGLEKLAERIAILKAGKPETEHEPWLVKGNAFKLTATWGYGNSLFDKPEFGLTAIKPPGLKRMPDFPNEDRDAEFDLGSGSADLLVQFSAAHLFSVFRAVLSITKPGKLPFELAGLHRGFQRADDRGMLRFFDGTSNLTRQEREAIVPVAPGAQGGLEWCDGGTFMVVRKLREEVREWEALDQAEQERRIGRRKVDGMPLGAPSEATSTHPTFRNPDFQGENAEILPESHIRKTNIRGSSSTKIFRRGWPYFDGFGADGKLLAGLLFVSFQHDLSLFEIIRQSWMPPGFPGGNTPADGLMRAKVIHLVTGGYYFVPRRSARHEAFPGGRAIGVALRGTAS